LMLYSEAIRAFCNPARFRPAHDRFLSGFTKGQANRADPATSRPASGRRDLFPKQCDAV
jgi:hypothetical protein